MHSGSYNHTVTMQYYESADLIQLSGMTDAVVCGSMMLWAGLVDGHRTAFLAPVWGIGRAGCRGSVACGVAHCAQFGSFRFVFTFLYFSCLCLCGLCDGVLPVYGVIKKKNNNNNSN